MYCIPFLSQNIKSLGHPGYSKFVTLPARDSMPEWSIGFICGTNTTHKVTMYNAPFPNQKVTSKMLTLGR